MKKTAKIVAVAVILLILGSGSAMAATWASNTISLLFGDKNQAVVYNPDTDTLEGADRDRTIITVDHASGWKYGDHFYFFDISQPFANDTGVYGEWHPRLSLGKMTGKNAGYAFVKDVLIAAELNAGSGWRAYLYGMGCDLDIPHFDFFALNIFIRDDMTIDESTWQISPSWNLPFTVGGARFEFGGFLDYSGAEGNTEAQLVAQPQLLLDIGDFSGNAGRFYAGIEYQCWQNKFGIKDVDENYVQLMGKWVF